MIEKIELLFENALDTFDMNSFRVEGSNTILAHHCSNISMLGAWAFRAELIYFTLMRTRMFSIDYAVYNGVLGQLLLVENPGAPEMYIPESLSVMVAGAAIQESVRLNLRARSCEFIGSPEYFDTKLINGNLMIQWPSPQQIFATRLRGALRSLRNHLPEAAQKPAPSAQPTNR